MVSAVTTPSLEVGLAHRRPNPPPLENGDRLTRAEFERRYEAMPRVKKAELIEGIVHMGSPVRHQYHGRQHMDLCWWLGHYRVHTPGTDAGDNSTLRLDPDNEPQPDALLRLLPEAGGACQVDGDGYLSGPPELIAEIASSSASYDLREKRHVYRRNGVREYLVWLVEDERIEWWQLLEGEYQSLPVEDNVIRSRVFPGLWLDVRALLAGDLAVVLDRLNEGLRSEEHGAFVEELKKRITNE